MWAWLHQPEVRRGQPLGERAPDVRERQAVCSRRASHLWCRRSRLVAEGGAFDRDDAGLLLGRRARRSRRGVRGVDQGGRSQRTWRYATHRDRDIATRSSIAATSPSTGMACRRRGDSNDLEAAPRLGVPQVAVDGSQGWLSLSPRPSRWDPAQRRGCVARGRWRRVRSRRSRVDDAREQPADLVDPRSHISIARAQPDRARLVPRVGRGCRSTGPRQWVSK